MTKTMIETIRQKGKPDIVITRKVTSDGKAPKWLIGVSNFFLGWVMK